MISISQAVVELLNKKPFITEGIQAGILNYAGVARLLKPEIEDIVMKEVTSSSIVMALHRNKPDNTMQPVSHLFKKAPDLIVRSNVVEVTIRNSVFSHSKYKKLLDLLDAEGNYFLVVTQSVFETTCIMSQAVFEVMNKVFTNDEYIVVMKDLSAITIALPVETVQTPGAYYQILRSLAWQGINVIEVASTYTEFTIIIQNVDVDHAFSTLKGMFRS